MDEIARLQKLLAESESLRLEEQRQREEEQRRREAAEKIARASQPQTLERYLDNCHSLSLAIQVVTDRSLTTQGDTTNPTGRVYPRWIVPWRDFPAMQEEIWNHLSEPSFASQPVFPSQHQLDYVRSLIGPISSEHGLRYYERDTVENAVQKLVDAVYENLPLRDSLGLRGSVTFESHTNLGAVNDNLSENLERMSLSGGGPAGPAPTAADRKPRRPTKAKGKGNRADQFCIYRTSDGAKIPATAIEYKAPHKLSRDEVIQGLASEIQPGRDIINKNEAGFEFAAKTLATTVVTQLFSYMIGKGIQYGYVCTGEAFIFLHIPDDPDTVFYHVCVPNADVVDDDENKLHHTAVSQVFAFILQALRAEPPPQSWHDAAAELDIWAVEYDDVLSRIPETVRKDKDRRASSYRPQRWRGFERSPIQTRSRCQQQATKAHARDDDDDEEDTPASPTLNRLRHSGTNVATTDTASRAGRARGSGDRTQGRGQQEKIQDQPYCTQNCLAGLVFGRTMDKNCPNAHSHGARHISRTEFLRLLRAQLAQDRGRDADCTPLYLSGSVGSLFKLRLTTHGYTLVAKGVEAENVARLQHEADIYSSICDMQGMSVPVCCGLINLALPYYYDSTVFEHFLLLSWAGRPLSRCTDQLDKRLAIEVINEIFTELHRRNILHLDAEPRNILYNSDDDALMVADFERAESRRRSPLESINPNGRKRKRVPKMPRTLGGTDDFTRELHRVVEGVSRCFGSGPETATLPVAAGQPHSSVANRRRKQRTQDSRGMRRPVAGRVSRMRCIYEGTAPMSTEVRRSAHSIPFHTDSEKTM